MQGAIVLPQSAWLAFAFVLGLVVGSFLNVVVHRVPRGESIVHPRSHCPRCGATLRWIDNLPLLSYALLGGHCRGCAAPISWRYPAIELVCGLLFAAVAWRFGVAAMTPIGWAFGAALLAAAAIDFDHQIIPDEISLGGLALALGVLPAAAWATGQAPGPVAGRALAGALVGGGLLWVVGFGHARVSVALGRRFVHWPGEGEDFPRPGSLDYWTWFPGVGFGDVKLLAMIGAVLGPFGALETIIGASALGLAFGGVALLLRHRWDAPFGFAPAIAWAAIAVLLAPDAWRALAPLGTSG